MTTEDKHSGDEKKNERPPPVDGVEYPEKPQNASAMDMMMYMERVDRYWQKRGLQRLHDDDEESADEQE
jgi:hypothetical protein